MGFSQEKVARAINISLSQYKNIERGRTENFNYKILFRLKVVFGLEHVEDLFDDVNLTD